MNSVRKLLWFFLLNLLPVYYCFSQDILVLKNNNSLSGKIIDYQQDTVVLKSEYGILKIPRNEILRIDFNQLNKINNGINKSNQEKDTNKVLTPEPLIKASTKNNDNKGTSDSNPSIIIIPKKDLKKISTLYALEGITALSFTPTFIFMGLRNNANFNILTGILNNDLNTIEKATHDQSLYDDLAIYCLLGGVAVYLVPSIYDLSVFAFNKKNANLSKYKAKLSNTPEQLTLLCGLTCFAIGGLRQGKASRIYDPVDDYPYDIVSNDKLNQARKYYAQARTLMFIGSGFFAATAIIKFVQKPYPKKEIEGFHIESFNPQFYPNTNSLCLAINMRF
jgi:hypothetical protein